MKHSMFILLLGFMVSASAEPYRECMKNEMVKSLKSMECDFRKLNTARSTANSKCGPKLLKELLADPTAKVGSDEFKSKLDNIKRSGNGDIDELAQKRADECGVKLSISGDTVTVTSKEAK